MMVAAHSFRAVIHPCDIDTTDRSGRLEQAAVKEQASVSQQAGWRATSVLHVKNCKDMHMLSEHIDHYN